METAPKGAGRCDKCRRFGDTLRKEVSLYASYHYISYLWDHCVDQIDHAQEKGNRAKPPLGKVTVL